VNPSRAAPVTPLIYVVIPALNEAANLAVLLPLLRSMPEIARLCVADGGSADASQAIAHQHNCLFVPSTTTQRNRGAQMNGGVAALQSEAPLPPNAILWFLHADARPHRNAAKAVAQAARDLRVVGGNFRMRFDERRPATRLFEFIARLQRSGGIYYGDSGIWVRAKAFQALAGYPQWPLFEDYDLVRRMERLARRGRGCTRCLVPALVVSSRRFRYNPARVLAIWAAFQLLFWLGTPPHTLARLYHRS
jgi:glycosyltransferase involved in cell wall biosynthesis